MVLGGGPGYAHRISYSGFTRSRTLDTALEGFQIGQYCYQGTVQLSPNLERYDNVSYGRVFTATSSTRVLLKKGM
eukprot:1665271-Rhodomonas_salina.2